MSQKRLLAILLMGVLFIVLAVAGCRRSGSRGRVSINPERPAAGPAVKPAEVLSAVAYRRPAEPAIPVREPIAAPAPQIVMAPPPVQALPAWAAATGRIGPVYTLSGTEPPRDLPLIQPPAILAAAKADLAPVAIPPLASAAPAVRPASAAPLPELTPDSYSSRFSGSAAARPPMETISLSDGVRPAGPDRLEIQRALLPLDWQPIPPLASLDWNWVASSTTAMRGGGF